MKRRIPWLMAGLITVIGMIQAVYSLQRQAAAVDYLYQLIFTLGIGLLAFIGALIIIRQDGNRIGWLMLALALVTALPVFYDPLVFEAVLPEPPARLTPGIWVILWVQGWFWLNQILIIFQIVLRFPDGKPPSGRWNWINTATLATLMVAVLVRAFKSELGPINSAWDIDNPIGWMSQAVFDGSSLIWVIGLLALAGGSLAALVSRFRKGTMVARQQIRWLLFAAAVQIGMIVVTVAYFAVYPESPGWLNVIAQTAFLTFPLAIVNAVFRYRLYEIDIIIRRTLQYAILTGLLVLLYFGGIVFLQSALSPLAGDGSSPLVTVVTTLGVAALFNPLRVRIQDFIDRRFFRNKYDAEQTLGSFAEITRDEVDMDRLSRSLLTVVEDTMQPEQVSLWLRESQSRKNARM